MDITTWKKPLIFSIWPGWYYRHKRVLCRYVDKCEPGLKPNTRYYLDNTNFQTRFLWIVVPPSCTVRLTYQTVIEGNIATFHCDAKGNPTPKITWMKDGMTVGQGNTLSFEANRNQSGHYWCFAQNTFNTTANASSYLDVHCKWIPVCSVLVSLNVICDKNNNLHIFFGEYKYKYKYKYFISHFLIHDSRKKRYLYGW